MQKLPLIAVMAVFLAAGCVGQPNPNPTTGSGLEITSFTSDIAEQYSGRTVRLLADFENDGESTVDMLKSLVWLDGPIVAAGTGSSLQWQLESGKTQAFAFIKNLVPRDPVRDTLPGTASTSWKLTAPQLDAGQRKTDTFRLRAYYDYETKSVGEMVAYTEAESSAIKERGDQLETSAFSNTVGPVAISTRVLPDPVTLYSTDADSFELATLEITISNVGGGTIYGNNIITSSTPSPSLKFENLNKVTLTITTALEQSGTGCGGEQELISGKPTTITCDYKVKASDVSTSKHFPVKVVADYGYYTEKDVEVTALGK